MTDPMQEPELMETVLLTDLVRSLRRWFYEWPDHGGAPQDPTPASLRNLYDRLDDAEEFLDEQGLDYK